jgi:branched-chain amino acid transport system substrate-binding protein
LILQQAASIDLDVTFFGVDGMDGILSVENFDTSLAEGVMLLTPFSATATDEATVKFVTAYGEAHNGETPNQFAADSYDVIYAIKAAAEAANITPDMSNEEISEALTAAMLTIELDGLTGYAKWTENGECDKTPKAVVIKNGEYEMME